MKLGKKERIEIIEEYYGYPSFEGSYYRSLNEKELHKLDEYSKNPTFFLGAFGLQFISF
ncbi:MAG: hypothetical protein QXP88_00160 [Thermoproteota archaeon]